MRLCKDRLFGPFPLLFQVESGGKLLYSTAECNDFLWVPRYAANRFPTDENSYRWGKKGPFWRDAIFVTSDSTTWICPVPTFAIPFSKESPSDYVTFRRQIRRNARFTNCDLSGARFDNAIIVRCRFEAISLSRASANGNTRVLRVAQHPRRPSSLE